jgi:hypothetical protein
VGRSDDGAASEQRAMNTATQDVLIKARIIELRRLADETANKQEHLVRGLLVKNNTGADELPAGKPQKGNHPQ